MIMLVFRKIFAVSSISTEVRNTSTIKQSDLFPFIYLFINAYKHEL